MLRKTAKMKDALKWGGVTILKQQTNFIILFRDFHLSEKSKVLHFML